MDFSSKYLSFIDIEATDDESNRKMIQFSGLKTTLEGDIIEEIDVMINPEQELSEYIINLLKIDNEKLQKFPNFYEVHELILNFLENSTIISFGDFDYKFLKKSFQDINLNFDFLYYDCQLEIKKASSVSTNASLSNLFRIIKGDVDKKYLHNALYDAYMLYVVFFEYKKITNEELKQIVEISQLVPRISNPKNLIFSKYDFQNIVKNKPNSKSIVFVTKLIINKFDIKINKKKVIRKYIEEFEFFYNNKSYSFKNPYKNMGENIYSNIYKYEINNFLNLFISIIKFSAIFFSDCGKNSIQYLLEIIYDIYKKYFEIEYISLTYLAKKIKSKDFHDLKTAFINIVNEQPEAIKLIFKDYYDRNKS